jgi:hypothetical protein
LGFLLVFAFGYVYSVVRAPILQNNALYFSFPLIILVAANGITLARKELSTSDFTINPMVGHTRQGQNKFHHYSKPLAILLPALLLFYTFYQIQFLTLERKGSHHASWAVAPILRKPNEITFKHGELTIIFESAGPTSPSS